MKCKCRISKQRKRGGGLYLRPYGERGLYLRPYSSGRGLSLLKNQKTKNRKKYNNKKR